MLRRCALLAGVLVVLASLPCTLAAQKEAKAVKYVRFQAGQTTAYGVVEGDMVRELSGPFGQWKPTDVQHALKDVKVLTPVERPTKVIALAGNYRDHLGDKPPAEFPQPFYKLPSCLIASGEYIDLPETTEDVHYEAEVVIVMGKKAKDVSEKEALNYVLGITCGNDVSARIWQKADVQWWRAKGSDTFGPVGPYIAAGIDYGNLDMALRVNGEVRQKTNTKNMIHNIAQTVSFISQHVTLEPGDLIYTGTPGRTQPIVEGDVVEVQIEGVGVLKNKVVGGTAAGKQKELIRRKIPVAASLSAAEFSKLARSETGPSLNTLPNQPLSLLLFALRPGEGEAKQAEFRNLGTAPPKPADIAKEIYRKLAGASVAPDYATFIHGDRTTAIECTIEGDTAKGSVSFEAPGLYAGKVQFVAKRTGDDWQIEEFSLPAYGAKTVRDSDGKWKATMRADGN